MTSPSPVAVVYVNFNTRDETIESIRSVLETTRRPLEVVVVDNGSEDGSATAIRERFPQATVIEAGDNLGFAAGVNLGVGRSESPWVLLLNPDTIVLDGAVDAIVSFAESHPAHGLYGGRTLRPDGTTDPSSCWGRMSLWSLTSFALGLTTLFKRSRIFDPESLGRWERDSVREVPVITGCLLLTSRRAWEALGGMDERFFLYGEDADFSARAIRAGMRPVIVPDATIVHTVGGSTTSSGRKMSIVMAGKVTVLLTSWPPVAARVGVALLQTGAGLRALPAWLRRRSGTWTEVWRSRREWREGFPAARLTLFDVEKGGGARSSPVLVSSAIAPAITTKGSTQ